MSQEVIIQIRLTLPDGASYRVIAAPEPESVLADPIPPEPPVESVEWAGAVPIGNEIPNARRGIAVQQGNVWQIGQVHAQNHKPLKANARGLYCPTPIGQGPDGKSLFCPFRP